MTLKSILYLLPKVRNQLTKSANFCQFSKSRAMVDYPAKRDKWKKLSKQICIAKGQEVSEENCSAFKFLLQYQKSGQIEK